MKIKGIVGWFTIVAILIIAGIFIFAMANEILFPFAFLLLLLFALFFIIMSARNLVDNRTIYMIIFFGVLVALAGTFYAFELKTYYDSSLNQKFGYETSLELRDLETQNEAYRKYIDDQVKMIEGYRDLSDAMTSDIMNMSDQSSDLRDQTISDLRFALKKTQNQLDATKALLEEQSETLESVYSDNIIRGGDDD